MTEQAFADPSIEAAHTFRLIMGALARPGRAKPFTPAVSSPLPLWPTAAAVALTLCDFQTPVWLSAPLATAPVLNYLRFHAGATITSHVDDAAFAIASAEDPVLPLTRYARGTHEYPDRSTTLILQVPGFSCPAAVELRGPGLEAPSPFGVQGFGTAFWLAMAENHSLFPLGVDVIFVSPEAIAACPRSTSIRLLETV